MDTVAAVPASQKTVASPRADYDRMVPVWAKSRAVCLGERFVKTYDEILDTFTFRNLLIPFSPSMSQKQYNWYRAEAELPGISSEFAKMIVGGLLRKRPVITLPDSAPPESADWIMNEFGQDDSSMLAFMDQALWEEIQTSRAWVYVDYPRIDGADSLSRDERLAFKPYPVLWGPEKVINWKITPESTGRMVLERVVTRELVEDYSKNEFHPEWVDTVRVHDVSGGRYRVRVYRKRDAQQTDKDNKADVTQFDLVEEIVPLANGEPISFIPAWPLNGSIPVQEPVLMPIINKEIALYNKMSRRNHLLYGAATYTPVISADMTDDAFDAIVEGGLGTWIKLPLEGKASVLETPTAALADMDRAIAAAIEEMARLGIRMLTPETDQSGVALHLRNAAQTAQLGSLNSRISSVMSQVVAFMINWRYDLEISSTDVKFTLSEDFNQTPLGTDWLRLATEWYESGRIPRSVWVQILKNNDMLPPEYDDEQGQKEIAEDQDLLMAKQEREMIYAAELSAELAATTQGVENGKKGSTAGK